jgi:enamine deaminase RidA (YjgF/YER057c/UK114 family)
VASSGTTLGTPWAEKTRLAIGHFVQFLDEHRPLDLQIVDHVAIVNDLVADIDRRAITFDRAFDDLDRPVDPCTSRAARQ